MSISSMHRIQTNTTARCSFLFDLYFFPILLFIWFCSPTTTQNTWRILKQNRQLYWTGKNNSNTIRRWRWWWQLHVLGSFKKNVEADGDGMQKRSWYYIEWNTIRYARYIILLLLLIIIIIIRLLRKERKRNRPCRRVVA